MLTADQIIGNFLTKIMKNPPVKEVIDFCQACENLIFRVRYFIYF